MECGEPLKISPRDTRVSRAMQIESAAACRIYTERAAAADGGAFVGLPRRAFDG